jgi:hypothetical protein
MLVYGDHCELADPSERLDRIAAQLAQASTMEPGLRRHSLLVAALIDAGRVQQGLADADFALTGHDRRTDRTDAVGGLLMALAKSVRGSWDSGFAHAGELPSVPQLRELPAQVELRTPEGFAFYGVYPEAYDEAARRLKLSAAPRVIGIRSIGTTLAAMVAAALDAPPPVTLRPHGDPFEREVSIGLELEQELLSGDAHYVIVDEGPGQSGSSFGAVADWLESRGVPLERMAFLPSHGGSPGPQASEAHRRRWENAQRVPADFGQDLPQLLESWLTESIGELDAPLEDISGGEWRRLHYASELEWPAAAGPWERRKFIASASGGRFLVKFIGLGAVGERKLGMARTLHASGLAAEPIGLAHGFLVERWRDDSRPLVRGEKPISDVGRYIGARARLFPADEGSGASLNDLLHMSRRNVALALGDEIALLLDGWEPRLPQLSHRVVRIRTDNRLLPHEWLRSDGGRMIKADALDHHAGHDLIGCQDIAWDVAGAIVEFELDDHEPRELVLATERAAGRYVDHELLQFLQVAYVAFRIGQESLTSSQDSSEDSRHSSLRQRYIAQLHDLLHVSTGCATRRESLVG